jgi:hypothetical protein
MVRIGQDQNVGIGQFLADAPANFNAVQHIKIDIEDDKVRTQTPDHFSGGHAVCGFADDLHYLRDNSLQSEAN